MHASDILTVREEMEGWTIISISESSKKEGVWDVELNHEGLRKKLTVFSSLGWWIDDVRILRGDQEIWQHGMSMLSDVHEKMEDLYCQQDYEADPDNPPVGWVKDNDLVGFQMSYGREWWIEYDEIMNSVVKSIMDDRETAMSFMTFVWKKLISHPVQDENWADEWTMLICH